MTDRIIELAKLAGLGRETPDDYFVAVWSANPTSLQRFAELVRNEALEEAAKACDTKHAIRSRDGFPREASSARALAKELRSMKT